ncbi:hypothetical protein CVT24_009466 [Panaeolus cyanescens]|uniref:Uncharacterized protein n=1 Tax=Panaeolus cyanescens TaxID=181874 RepID=A0A409WRT5_9AGAR|nr:hypothetical protein CVT24_009466 [Panaeolus cyanescens]
MHLGSVHCPEGFALQDCGPRSFIAVGLASSMSMSPLGDYRDNPLPLQDTLLSLDLSPCPVTARRTSLLLRQSFNNVMRMLENIRRNDSTHIHWSVRSRTETGPSLHLIRNLFRCKNIDNDSYDNPYSSWPVDYNATPQWDYVLRRYDLNPVPVYDHQGSLCPPELWSSALLGSLVRVHFGLRNVLTPSPILVDHMPITACTRAGIMHRVDILDSSSIL